MGRSGNKNKKMISSSQSKTRSQSKMRSRPTTDSKLRTFFEPLDISIDFENIFSTNKQPMSKHLQFYAPKSKGLDRESDAFVRMEENEDGQKTIVYEGPIYLNTYYRPKRQDGSIKVVIEKGAESDTAKVTVTASVLDKYENIMEPVVYEKIITASDLSNGEVDWVIDEIIEAQKKRQQIEQSDTIQNKHFEERFSPARPSPSQIKAQESSSEESQERQLKKRRENREKRRKA